MKIKNNKIKVFNGRRFGYRTIIGDTFNLKLTSVDRFFVIIAMHFFNVSYFPNEF